VRNPPAVSPWARLGVVATLGLGTALGGLAAATVAKADPAAVAAKLAEVQALEAQLNALGAQESAAVEAYNGARYRLGVAQQRIRINGARLREARAEHKTAQKLLAARLVAIYRQGPVTMPEVILSSGSLSAISGRLDAMKRIAKSDGEIVQQLAGLRKRIRTARVTLVAEHAIARRQVVLAAEQKQRVEAVLAQRAAILKNSRAQLVVLVEQERRRQAELAAAAARRIAYMQAQRERAATVQRLTPGAPAQTLPGVTAPVPQASGSGSPLTGGAPAPAGTPQSPSVPSTVPGATGGRLDVVQEAMKYLGTPYRWGGSGPGGFDCSGFTSYVYSKFGRSLPHYTGAQYTSGARVSEGNLEPGDLVFFNGVGHEGIYIGGGKFIHAPHTGDVVKISSLNDGYYRSTYDGAVRPGG
jgi:cell wall-associated NlpC family hydrolase